MRVNDDDLADQLHYLNLTATEAAVFLMVHPQTLRCWFRRGVPGPARIALASWCRLRRMGEPWRPGAVSITSFHDIPAVLDAVKRRGGSASPWAVDVKREDAALGPVLMTFRLTASPYGFLPISYERSDAKPDLERDRFIIEDGIYRIAAAVSQAKAA